MIKRWQDGVDRASIATLPELGNFKCVGSEFLTKKDPFEYEQDLLELADGFSVDLFNGTEWYMFTNRQAMTFDPAASLDTGNSLQFGKDYYVYLVFDGTEPEIVVSLNTTFPQGATAENSRKIGGFHYGSIRKVSDDGLWIPIDSDGTKFGSSGSIIWKDNVTKGIVPNAVWDLKNKPKNFMPGLAKVGNVWLGLYQASLKSPVSFIGGATSLVHVAGGELQNKYGELPATGTEGLCQFNFNELAQKQGMRLPSYSEWLAGAFGSPQGLDSADTYGWTKTSNTARTRTGCRVDAATGAYVEGGGTKPYAISAYNLVDCVGNVDEWTKSYMIRQDSTSWKWQNVLGAGMGQAYLPNSVGLSALVCGRYWHGGSCAGARALSASYYPWLVSPDSGVRLACDAA